jgi:hypothetical protein
MLVTQQMEHSLITYINEYKVPKTGKLSAESGCWQRMGEENLVLAPIQEGRQEKANIRLQHSENTLLLAASRCSWQRFRILKLGWQDN